MCTAFEVIVHAIGELSVADLGAVPGAVGRVHALVTTVDGQVEAEVRLVTTRAGCAEHRALGCPNCGEPARLLRAHDRVLRCARCQPHRTARQLERTTRWWSRDGGRMTDQLLRTARRRHGPDHMQQLERLASNLMVDDQRRVAAVMPLVRAALALGGSP